MLGIKLENGVKNVSKAFKYKAFGLRIESAFQIVQLIIDDKDDDVPDVIIRKCNYSFNHTKNKHIRRKGEEFSFTVQDIAEFHIAEGRLIEVHPYPECTDSLLAVYLMGSCMGAILHQRGYMPLHGSCVTDGKHSVLITGDSGAGKSTLAAEFLSRGWKLLTDDVAPVYDIDSIPMAQSSYPSQKLWQDSLAHYKRQEEDIHSLYFNENREKFGVNVSEYFYDGSAPLSFVIRLIPADMPCTIQTMEGMTSVDQLMQNTYRSFMIAPENRERHFRRCVALANKVPMAYITRQNGMQCAATLYEMIMSYLKEDEHEQSDGIK